jgi:hypothetical protein
MFYSLNVEDKVLVLSDGFTVAVLGEFRIILIMAAENHRKHVSKLVSANLQLLMPLLLAVTIANYAVCSFFHQHIRRMRCYSYVCRLLAKTPLSSTACLSFPHTPGTFI